MSDFEVYEAIAGMGVVLLFFEYVAFVAVMLLLPVVWFIMDLVDRKQSKKKSYVPDFVFRGMKLKDEKSEV